MREQHKCPICGKPTSSYFGTYREDGLCREHKDMLTQGLIEQCPDCQKWHETGAVCECKRTSKVVAKESNCIICGESSNGKSFCTTCWKGIKVFYKDITHLSSIYQAKEYYYNLKNSIFWINKMDYAKDACKKLYAIAQIIDDFRNGNQVDIAIHDIVYLLTKKKEYLTSKEEPVKEYQSFIVEHDEYQGVSEEVADYRRMYPATVRCKDGHYVRSNNEKTIDDRLYEKKIFHEYETRYKAIDGQPYYPDFYIPEAKLYIEYFGVSENKEKNEKKRQLFLQDTKYHFEFIPPEKAGVLDEVIEDIIEKYGLNKD